MLLIIDSSVQRRDDTLRNGSDGFVQWCVHESDDVVMCKQHHRMRENVPLRVRSGKLCHMLLVVHPGLRWGDEIVFIRRNCAL